MSGMHSDNYELARSSAPQSIQDYSAFTDKQWSTKPDTSGGVYQSQNAMVEFDLSGIYLSDAFSDVSDFYIVLPTVLVACCSAGAAPLACPTAGYGLCALKNNYQNLIHSMEVTLDGKTIHDHQSFLNVYSNFKMLSSMSPSDLKSNNTSFGMASDLDSFKSTRFTNATAANTGPTGAGQSGFGITNNVAYTTSASFQQTIAQNSGKGNDALLQRINRYADVTTNSSYNNLYGSSRIVSEQQLKNEFKPYFTTDNALPGLARFMYWFDYAIINLKYIVDAVAKIGLVKTANLKLRMYVNTGAVQITVDTPNSANTAYTAMTTSFSNTCPITVNLINGAASAFTNNLVTTANAGGLPDTCTRITAGLYLAKVPDTFNGGGDYSIPITKLSHPMSQCLLYNSSVKLALDVAKQYADSNRAKKIIYEKIYFSSNLAVGAGNSINKTISNSIKYPISLTIIPFVAKNTVGGSIATYKLPFAQWESPWDTAPSTSAPLSLTGLSVTLGARKVSNDVLNYTYENFLQQVSLAETLTSSDIGLNVGLVNQEYWENNRVYYFDLARSRDIDKEAPRELTVYGTNNSSVPIDVLFFVTYLDEFTLDVVTGVVTM